MPVTPRIRPAVLLALMALVLSGCMVDVGIEVRDDDTAAVDISFGVQAGAFPDASATEDLDPEEAQGDVEEVAGRCGFDPGAVSTEEFEQDGFQGVRVRVDPLSLEALNCFFTEDADDALFETFSLTREGDTYVFNASLAPLDTGFDTGQKRRGVEVAEAVDIPTDLLGTELDRKSVV